MIMRTQVAIIGAQLQRSQLQWVTSSAAGSAGLAENNAGLPISY
jgi:p-hydroxybenzoate 3-monooxygenase